MKTLDEVIKNLEDGTEHLSAMLISRETWSDALYYLKEYREKLNTRIYIPEGYTREKTGFTHQDFANTFREEPHFIRDVMVGTSQNLCNTSQNNPLTWDELKNMVGKPVWVEALLYKQWAVIAYIGEEYIRFEGANLYAPECRIYMGEDNGWQAYRKERA